MDLRGIRKVSQAVIDSWWIVLLVFTANLLLRTIDIGAASLYLDEAQTLFQIQKSPTRIIDEYVVKQQNAPLYFLLTHYWGLIFGYSLEAIRFFSVLAMAITATLMFLLGRRYLGRTAAFGIAIVFPFINDFTYYGQEARGYALISCLAVGFIWTFIRLWQKPEFKRIWPYTLLGLVLLFTHYLTIYLFLVCFVIALIEGVRNFRFARFYVIANVMVLLLFLPWIRVVLEVMPESGSFWISEPTWGIFKNSYYYIIHNKLKTHITWAIMAIGLILWVIKYKRISREHHLLILLLVLWGTLPNLLNYWLGYHIPVFIRRYTFYASFGFVMAFFALSRLWPIPNGLKVLLFVAFAFFVGSHLRFGEAKIEDWKGAVAKVKALKSDSNFVFVQSSYTAKAFCYYYDEDLFFQTEEFTDSMSKDNIHFISRESSIKKFEDRLPEHKLLLLRSHWKAFDGDEKIRNYLKSRYREEEEVKEYDKIDFFIYRDLR